MLQLCRLILISLAVFFSLALTCQPTPPNPYDPSNTVLTVFLKGSNGTIGQTAITDTLNDTIHFGLLFNYPSNVDSVHVTAAIPNGSKDSLFPTILNVSKMKYTDTLWYPLPLGDTGKISITATAYLRGDLTKTSSGSVTVVSRPLNHKPELVVKGALNILPGQACTLTVSAVDPDSAQVLKFTTLSKPNGSNFDAQSRFFTWQSPTGFIGRDSVIFNVEDNGHIPLSDVEKVYLRVSTTVTTVRPVLSIKGISNIKPGDACTLHLSALMSDTSQKAGFEMLNGPFGCEFHDSVFTWVTSSTYSGTASARFFAYNVFQPSLADTKTVNINVSQTIPLPSRPDSLVIVERAQGKLILKWRTTAATDFYSIFRAQGKNGAFQPIDTVFTPLFTDSIGFGAYSYFVKGMNSTGASPSSDTVYSAASNQAPKWQKDTVNLDGAIGITLSVSLNDKCADPDGDTLSFVLLPGNPDKDTVKNGQYTFTPALSDTGITWPRITAKDAQGLFDTLTFRLAVPAQKTQKTTFALTISSTNGNVTKIPDFASYDSGTTVTLTPTPATGFHFTGWTGALTGTDNPGTVIMNGAKAVTAMFAANKPNSFALTVAATNGTVKKTPDLSEYDSGSVVGLKATPSTGYGFANWSGDATGTTDSTTVIMASVKSVTANFVIKTYQLTLSAGTGGTISAPATSPATLNHGAPTTITAAPGTGYNFVKWTVTTGSATIADSTSATTTVTLTSGNATITANFASKTYQLTVTAGTGGTISAPATSPATVNHGAPTSITAAPGAGNNFVKWTVTTGSATIADSASATSTATLTSGNATVTANFSLKTYQLTVTAQTGGTISKPTSSPVTVNHGVQTDIEASPSSGYNFVNWTIASGSASFVNSNSQSTKVTLTSGNAAVTANFQLTTYSVTYYANGGTSGSAPTDSKKYTSGSLAIILPNSGKLIKSNESFIGWNKNGSGTLISCGQKVYITENVSLYAQYSNYEVMDNDGNRYNTVTIGGKTWMTQNLKTTKYNNGDPIPLVEDEGAWKSLTTGAYCWPMNDSANKEYGALYNWYTVKTGNLAPAGWHVATSSDWYNLVDSLGCDSFACKIKENGGTHWASPNECATNTAYFYALGNGSRGRLGLFGENPVAGSQGFIGFKEYAAWWTSTEYFVPGASAYLFFILNTLPGNCSRNDFVEIEVGYGVRCIKD